MLTTLFSIGIFASGIFIVVGIGRAIADSWQPANRSSRSREKQVAIQTYSKQLGQELRTRYGVREKYPPDKIKTTIKQSGLSSDRDCYGIAMYADRNDFIEYHRSIGESCDYDAMRSEISECLSLPDNTFSTSEAIAAGELFTDRGDSTYESNSSSDDSGSSWSFWSGGSSEGGGYDGGGSSDSSTSSDGGGSSDSGSSSD